MSKSKSILLSLALLVSLWLVPSTAQAAPSAQAPLNEWSYVCTDLDQRINVSTVGMGIGNESEYFGPATLNVADGVVSLDFVEFVTAQVIVRKFRDDAGPVPGQAVVFTPNVGAPQTLTAPTDIISDSRGEQAYVYRARFEEATTVTAEVTDGVASGNFSTPRSFVLFIYSSNPQFISVGQTFYDFVFRSSATETLAIPTASQARDVLVDFDVTDLKSDARYVDITATVGSPPNQISDSQRLTSSNQGDELAFAQLLLPNVPGDATEITIAVDSPPRNPLPGGASAILGTASVRLECIVGALGDFVFADSNGNGLQDEGEPGVPGVTVNLLDGAGNPVLGDDGQPITATTDDNGEYIFEMLNPGQTYIVEFVAPEGSTFTLLNAGDDEVDSDADPLTGRSAPITLGEGQVDLTIDAGLVAETEPDLSSIGDFIFEDSNGNGIQDEGEPGIPGVVVNLLDGAGNPVLDDGGQPITTVTNSDGAYNFTNLDPELIYIVEFVAPGGRTFTTPNAGNEALDSDADQTSGRTGPITLNAGEENDTVDAGLLPLPQPELGSIGNTVFCDSNGNGVADPGEGIAGVAVQLTSASGNVSPIVDVTDDNGNYLFEGLPEGSYTITVVGPLPVDCDVPSVDPDGPGTPPDGSTTVELTPGEQNPDIDFGYQPPATASIGDFVFEDTDGDGLQDDGENGIPGVTVNLLDGAGNPVLDDNNQPITTVTGDDGEYSFSALDPELTYIVEFVAPNDRTFTTPNAGDEATDSDADVTTGRTGPITLAADEENDTVDAGLLPLARASIGDFVFEDTNENGLQDDGEPGLPGVTVNLLIDTDGDGTPDTQINTTTTGANGEYSFSDLDPSQTYFVQVAPPAGRSFTPANAGDDTIDSDIIPALGYSAPITLVPGEVNNDVDAGLLPEGALLASIGDFVFEDSNSNGLQDAGEPGVADVTVNLWRDDDADGTPDQQIGETTTDENGAYSFAGLDPALAYIVLFTAPEGRTFTTPNAGDDSIDSDANVESGVSATITLTAGENDDSVDAGLLPVEQQQQPASLGDLVFLDANENGLQDAGEPGITGVTVNLLVDSDGDGTPDEQVNSTTTSDGGLYSFTDLDASLTYFVQFVASAGSSFTTPNAGDDAIDSDAGVDNGLTGPITLAPGEVNNTIDAGIITDVPLASEGGLVWLDQNDNGIRDEGEPGVPGVTVRLLVDDDGDGTPDRELLSTVTGEDGRYGFDNLDPSLTYIVEFAPENAEFTTPNVGDDTLDSDADAQGLTAPINLEPGESRDNVDAGLRLPTALDETDEPTQFRNFIFLPLVD